MRILAWLFALSLFSIPSITAADELEGLSLEELLDTELAVAAKSGRTIRESPGVVTLITREEILSSGARDLTDLLLRVPGVSFGLDVAGLVGIGFRGVWAHEGKVLLLVDGQEMNENLYSSTQWGHHIPAEHVERIEIIRGPGSAIYGGYAEMAVINVITRGAAALSGGGDSSIAYGQRTQDYARRSLSLAWGNAFENGAALSIAGTFGEGMRSQSQYRDFYGNSYDMNGASDLDGAFASVGASWKGASLRYVFDDYRMRQQDAYGENTATPLDQNFTTHSAELRWDAAVREGLVVTPRAAFRQQMPWRSPDKSSDQFYDKTVARYTAGLSAAWEALDGVNVLAGGETFRDSAYLNDKDLVGLQTNFQNGKSHVEYDNVAGFAQVLWDNDLANLAVGARFENHSQFGSSFVPRASLAKVMDRLHVKLLFSSAFRAPGIENIRLNEDIEPEKTTVFEAEAGYKASDKLFLTANVFDVTLRDPIVYFYSEDIGEAYLNYDRTGTRGVEAELRIQEGRRRAYLGASIYDARGKNEVDVYEVPGHGGALLGLPQLKLVGGGAAPLSPNVTIDVSAILIGPRFGYLEGDGAGDAPLEEESPTMLLNTFLWWRDVGLDRLDLGIGVFNLLDQKYRVLQPYAGGHAPIPLDEREIFGRLSYAF